jgi:hypothetical protein
MSSGRRLQEYPRRIRRIGQTIANTYGGGRKDTLDPAFCVTGKNADVPKTAMSGIIVDTFIDS